MKKIYTLTLLFIFNFAIAQTKSGKTESKIQAPITNITNPGDGGDPIPPTSGEVGVTTGQLSVSLTGAANYNIPIAVPPGINGVVPQIGLAYSSQSGNGLAGYGWNISGLSTITRIPSTRFHDNNIDPVDLDNLDRFALDGQRLIVKNGGVYGSNGAEYETENFSNLKVTSLWGTAGDLWFKVEYPDGSIAVYGGAANSVSKTVWGITSWQNPQGVNIYYSYNLVNNNLTINSIKYGTSGNTPSINEIQFTYKNRNRIEQSYVGGFSVINNVILSQIKVIGNGVGYRNYYLTHDLVLGYQRLTSIVEKTGDNSKSYNPTVFDYEQSLSGDSIEFSKTSTLSTTNINNNSVSNSFYPTDTVSLSPCTGDYDGDGNPDFILLGAGSDNKLHFNLFTNVNGNENNLDAKSYSIDGFSISDLFTINGLQGSLSSGYKMMNKQGWCSVIRETNSFTVKFNVYSRESDWSVS